MASRREEQWSFGSNNRSILGEIRSTAPVYGAAVERGLIISGVIAKKTLQKNRKISILRVESLKCGGYSKKANIRTLLRLLQWE
jgi:hypothetical protein